MKLSKFEEGMNKAEGSLTLTDRWGVCDTLSTSGGMSSSPAKNEFESLFMPGKRNKVPLFWLHDCKLTPTQNRNNRHFALLLFEQICITEKLYRKF